MVEPYYQEPNITIYCGDCLEIMKEIPDKSIDSVLTDPPWALGKKEYDTEKEMYAFKDAMPELTRILKDNKHFLCDTSYMQLFKTNEIIEPFLIYRQPIILYCNNQIGHRSFAGWNLFRIILWYCKTKPMKPVKRWRDVIEFPMKSTKNEGWAFPNPKDVYSYKKLLEMFSNKNDLVLDPFLGSGTTLIACKELNRRGIGIEISEKYCNIAIQRLKNSTPNLL